MARPRPPLSLQTAGALRRLSHRLRRPPPEPVAQPVPASLSPGTFDLWLASYWGDVLAVIDAACADAGPEAFALFRDLDPDLWALLLTQEYSVFAHIKALLPTAPEPELQEIWNGASGAALAAQSAAFYRRLARRYAEHSRRSLQDSLVLDFGCGWGRLTRLLARDVTPGRLCACDPVQAILDVCASSRVPADLRRCEFVPDSLPFDEPFDLAYAFSVFTHLSEPAHERSLQALYDAIVPGGLLVATIRPPEYLRLCERLHPLLASLGPEPERRLQEPLYLFAPHESTPLAVASPASDVTYGETVITPAYLRRHWSDRFELVDVDLLIGDPYQVMLTLRRA